MTSVSGSVRSGKRYLDLCLLLAASVVLWWEAIVSTLRSALDNDAYTHILLIVPLSVSLIYFESRQRPVITEHRGWAGAILLGMASCLFGLATWNVGDFCSDLRLSLSMFALVLWWIGSVILCFGLPAGAAASLPSRFSVPNSSPS